eukprot:TRINITY_DN7409_c0_g1_i2.p1 TRINITY_DN7409_c0_g1~~TRINITY_DN7409_c0_g1_i2.p1  ORF type:complete len:451 (-),score=102.23 TRINITY_DN7409_c0_g1_i2:86-1438(-)
MGGEVHQRHHHTDNDGVVGHTNNKDNAVLSPSNSDQGENFQRAASFGLLATINIAGGWVFGYNCGVVGGAVDVLELEIGSIVSWEKGLLTSSIVIGAMFGSILGGPFADKYGRRAGVLLIAALGLVLAVVLAASYNLPMIIAVRGLLGLPVGLSSAICPMYVAESAPVKNRGTLGTFFQLGICFSIFVSYCMTPIFLNVQDGWRFMFGLGAVAAIVLGAVGYYMPESPMWSNGKKIVSAEEDYLLLSTNASAQRNAKMPLRAALSVGVVLAVANQLTGINAFMFYANDIFSSAGVSKPIYATIGLGFWNFASALVATFFVDRLGRRPLILGGTVVMAISCVALGLVTLLHNIKTVGALSVVLLFVFILAFESGDGPLFWITMQELFTEENKTFGATFLNATQWCFNIMLCFGFPVLSKQIGQANCFYIFGGVGVICSVVLFFALPETKTK